VSISVSVIAALQHAAQADHALPGDDYEGRLESTVDSLRMLRHSQALFLMLLVFVSTVCAQQYFHERVRAQNPNEMTRALWRNARAPIVWLASLLLWWATPPRWRVGEPLPPRAGIRHPRG
jgi:hypothetical protein